MVIIVAGFGGSGSSAVVDLLRECRGLRCPSVEFRLLVDPDGIMSLENGLVHNWSPYHADTAIKRFRRLARCLSRKFSYPYFGLDLRQDYGRDFEARVDKYLEQLVCASFEGSWYGLIGPHHAVARKLNRILRRHVIPLRFPMFISCPGEHFLSATRHFLRGLLKDDSETVVLDEGYASLHPARVLTYFHSAKMVIVHRDPRDTYVNALYSGFQFVPARADAFVEWYRLLYSTSMRANPPNALRIQFENLVLDYENTKTELFRFLELNDDDHVHKRAHFNPADSRKNVGLWKDFYDTSAIDLIGKSLGEFCYNL